MNATTQKYALTVLRVLLIALRRRHQLTVHINEIQTEVFKHLRVTKEKHRSKGRNYIHAALQALETNKVVAAIDDDFDPGGQIRRADRKHIFRLTRKAVSWFDHQYGADLAQMTTDDALLAGCRHFGLLPPAVPAVVPEVDTEAEAEAVNDVRTRTERNEAAPWESPAPAIQTQATNEVFVAEQNIIADTQTSGEPMHKENNIDDAELVELVRNYPWYNRYSPAFLIAGLHAANAVSADKAVTAADLNWEPHKLKAAADVLANFGLITWARIVHRNPRRGGKRKYEKPTRSLPYLTQRGCVVAELGKFVDQFSKPVAAIQENIMLKNAKKQTPRQTPPLAAGPMVTLTLPDGQQHTVPKSLVDLLAAAMTNPTETAHVLAAATATATPPEEPPALALSIEQTVAAVVPDVLNVLCRKIIELQTAKISSTKTAEEINKEGLYHALKVTRLVVTGLRDFLRERLHADNLEGDQPLDVSTLTDYAEWFALSMEEFAAGRSRDIPLLALEDETRKLPVLRLQGDRALNEVRWEPDMAVQKQ